MFRIRYFVFFIGCSLALVASFFTDPLGGAATAVWLINAARFFLGLAAVFYGFRALSDYPEADGQALHKVAAKEPVGAGLALVYRGLCFIALALVFAAVAGNANAANVRTTIPANAPQYLPTLAALQKTHWPGMPSPEMLAGQTEKESCITLTHSRCWSATSRLKSAREEGAGLGQITRAYRANGALRFDALAELRAKHPALAAWNWTNVYQRPDLQLLAIVLKNRDNWLNFCAVRSESDRLRFALKANNRGVSSVMAEMRACGLRAGCDPQRFHGHAGDTCTASRRPIYGNRSACDISLAYMPGIEVRSPKYRRWFV